MKKSTYLFFLALLLTFQSFGQDIEEKTEFILNSDQVLEVDKRDKETKGTRYVNTKFYYGNIAGSNKNVLFKFDALLGEVEVKVDDKSSVYITKKLGTKVTFLNNAYRVFKNEEGNLTYYLTSKNCNKYCLLIKENKKLDEAVIPQNGYEKYKPPTFSKTKETFYVTFDGENAKKIPTKKKLFYKFFGEQEKAVKSFMKKNKLKRKKKEDLEKIITFYSNL